MWKRVAPLQRSCLRSSVRLRNALQLGVAPPPLFSPRWLPSSFRPATSASTSTSVVAQSLSRGDVERANRRILESFGVDKEGLEYLRSRIDVGALQTQHVNERLGLLSSYGLNGEQILRVLKSDPHFLVYNYSVQRGRYNIAMFLELGVKPTKLPAIISKLPALLYLDFDKRVKPKLEFFQSLGLGGAEIGEMVAQHPRILSTDLRNRLTRTISLLQGVGLEGDGLRSFLRSKSFVLTLRPEETAEKIAFLSSELHMSEADVVKVYGWCLNYGLRSRILPRVLFSKHVMATASPITYMRLSEEEFVRVMHTTKAEYDQFKLKLNVDLEKSPQVHDRGIREIIDVLESRLGFEAAELKKLLDSTYRVRYLEPADLSRKIEFLENLKLDRVRIKKILLRLPLILYFSVDGDLQRRLQPLFQLNYTAAEVGKIVYKFPEVFKFNFSREVPAKFEYFERELGITGDDFRRMLLLYPNLLGMRLEERIMTHIKMLQEQRLQRSTIRTMVSQSPSIFGLKPETVVERIRMLRQLLEMDVDSQICSFPLLLAFNVRTRVLPRLLFLRERGVLQSVNYSLSCNEADFIRRAKIPREEYEQFRDEVVPQLIDEMFQAGTANDS